jgi:hypothetical protein
VPFPEFRSKVNSVEQASRNSKDIQKEKPFQLHRDKPASLNFAHSSKRPTQLAFPFQLRK